MADKLEVKLTPPPDGAYNLLTVPYVIFECMSGEYKGNTRVINELIDSGKLPEEYRRNPFVRILTIGGYHSSGSYAINSDSDINYDWDKGVIDFSSNGVEYRIRAVQPTDKLYG